VSSEEQLRRIAEENAVNLMHYIEGYNGGFDQQAVVEAAAGALRSSLGALYPHLSSSEQKFLVDSLAAYAQITVVPEHYDALLDLAGEILVHVRKHEP
jgi:hypothetical protein